MTIMNRFALVAALATMAWLGMAKDAFAQAKKSDGVVKMKAEASKPNADGTTAVLVTLTIDRGWHLYANPVGQEDLADTATTLTVASGGKVESVVYPPGKVIRDKVLGEYKVYEDEVMIKAVVRRSPGTPLDLNIKLQACNDTKCLVPTTVKLSVP
jgi:DsbC/DsbD-like thiol-disulfide interchange protein